MNVRALYRGVVVLIGLGAASAQERDAIPRVRAIADDKLVSTVEKRVQSIQPRREERRFDEIGWASSLLEAKMLGERHNRPIFIFTHDGRVATGRC